VKKNLTISRYKVKEAGRKWNTWEKTLKEETILFSLRLDFVAVVEEFRSRKEIKQERLKEAA
jgi:hypothetical protein